MYQYAVSRIGNERAVLFSGSASTEKLARSNVESALVRAGVDRESAASMARMVDHTWCDDYPSKVCVRLWRT